jgi:hypothetical protein
VNSYHTWNKLFFHSAFYSQKWVYLYFFNNTIAYWSMLVRQFLRNLQMHRSFIAAITSTKTRDDNQKKFLPPLAIDNKFFIAYLPIPVRCKNQRCSQSCVRLNVHLAIKCLTANYCIRWRKILIFKVLCLTANYCIRWRRIFIFKGLSRDGGWAEFSKKPRRLSL